VKTAVARLYRRGGFFCPRSLSDLGDQSENQAGRGHILSIFQGNSCSIDQKSGGIWTVQTDLQQIYPKSDRLLMCRNSGGEPAAKQAFISLRAVLECARHLVL
jgi:hypothetical protein